MYIQYQLPTLIAPFLFQFSHLLLIVKKNIPIALYIALPSLQY